MALARLSAELLFKKYSPIKFIPQIDVSTGCCCAQPCVRLGRGEGGFGTWPGYTLVK